MRQDHPMTPGVLDARQQHEPNHPGRRADDADHSEQTLDMVQTDIINRLRIKAGMIQMGELIAWGSDSDLMYEAADMIEQLMARDEQYTPADMASQAAQGWRDGYRHAKGDACPEGYVMVPVEPTPEMLAATSWPNCAATDYAHMLAAAPDVQEEPVAWYLPGEGGCDSQFRDHATVKSCTGNTWAGWQPLYTAPQPAEQQPAPEVAGLVSELDCRRLLAGFAMDCNAVGADYAAKKLFRGMKLLARTAALAAHRKGARYD